MSDLAEPVVVFITVGSRSEAVMLAEKLVGERLAACVQILPEIESIYRWQGRVEFASEFLILIKTTRDRLVELEVAVLALHSYETPEIIAVPVTHCLPAYLAWLKESVGPASGEAGASAPQH